jgi:transposase
MDASHVQFDSLGEQVRTLLGAVDRLQAEVGQLRCENEELKKQVSKLQCDAGYWKSRHADALKRNELVQADLNEAKGEIRLLKAERFGKRSEKQWEVKPIEAIDDADQSAKKNKRGQQPGRPAPKRRDYSHLPVRTQSVDLPGNAKACNSCGKPLESLGYREDGEQLEIETVIYRRVVRRNRYRCTCKCKRPRTVIAPQPPKLLSKGLLGTSIWTHLLIEKFHLQRPMHRTLENLRLKGLDLAPGTVTDGLGQIAPLMTPIYEAIQTRQARSMYLHADETRWKVFTEKAGKKGYRWWLWVFAGNDAVNYVLDPSRSHQVPQSHCPEKARGVLVVDRYSGYKAKEQVKNGKLRLAFCWAHVRRDFMRVGKSYQQLQTWSLQWLARIKHLYHLNRKRLRCGSETKTLSKAEAALRKHISSMEFEFDTELSDSSLRQPCRKVLVSLKEH